MDRQYDIILWGATGFTGRLTSDYLVGRYRSGKWALAGRNKSSLEALSATLRRAHHLEDVSYVLANIEDAASLERMTSACKVLISIAGPNSICGEPIIKACLNTSTHYVDGTAELLWVHAMIKTYDKAAKDKGLKMVPCCGFDFVPNVMMLEQLSHVLSLPENADLAKTPREVNHSFSQSTEWVSGGTARSGLQLCKGLSFMESLRYFLSPYAMCSKLTLANLNPVVCDLNSYQILPHKVQETDSWCVPFVMSCLMSKFVHWTNEVSGHKYGSGLIYRGGERMTNSLKAHACAFLLWFQFFCLLLITRVSWLHRLLPEAGSGPKDVEAPNAYMKSELVAYVKLASAEPNPLSLEEDRVVRINWQIKGGESYAAAARFLVETAVAIVEGDCSERCGFLPVSSAVGMPLIERLKKHADVEMTISI